MDTYITKQGLFLLNLTRVVLIIIGKPGTASLVFCILASAVCMSVLNKIRRNILDLVWSKYNNFTRSIRRKFEHRWARFSVGLCIIPLSLIISLTYPNLAQGQELEIDPESIKISESSIAIIKTQESIRSPLSQILLTQGFSATHPAIDIKGPTNEPVFPIMRGEVTETIRSYNGYGNYIVVDHGQGLKSLYAHLNFIAVDKGQKVNTQTILGGLGSTGRSTGPHLHLEVIDNGKKINPLTVIGGK